MSSSARKTEPMPTAGIICLMAQTCEFRLLVIIVLVTTFRQTQQQSNKYSLLSTDWIIYNDRHFIEFALDFFWQIIRL